MGKTIAHLAGWALLSGCVAVACGGSGKFSSQGTGTSGSQAGDGGTSGSAGGEGGSNSGGSSSGASSGASSSGGDASGMGGSSVGGSSGGDTGGSSGSSGVGGSTGCSDGFFCHADELKSCSGGIATLVETCDSAALCNAVDERCDTPTCQAGNFRCRSTQLEQCNSDGTGFDEDDECLTSALCDAEAGACLEPACEEGNFVCDGSALQACKSDRTGFVEVFDCTTAALCDANNGRCNVAACTPNAYQCNSSGVLLQCNAGGTSLAFSDDCTTQALCNAGEGRCEAPACDPGEHECDGATLNQCSEGQDAFEFADTCVNDALCDADAGVCMPPSCDEAEYDCSGNVLRVCREDRTGFQTETPCTSTEECREEPPACVDMMGYAEPLDGFVIEVPCVAPHADARSCYSFTGTCPSDPDPVLNGARPTDQTLTFGGTVGVTYRVRLHVQGQVESREYTGGTDLSSSSGLPANGFHIGGTPATTNSVFNVYAMRVGSPGKDYFFNSIGTTGDNRVRKSTFDIDYTADVDIAGGSYVRMVASDSNCIAIKNCQDPESPNSCVAHSLGSLDSRLSTAIGGQPYDGQFIGFIVERVTRAP